MKKIKNILPLLGMTLALVACNFNEQNFPGFDAGVAPTNVFSYEDSLVAADYTAISKMILDTNLVVPTAADSAAATFLKTNLYFDETQAPSNKYIPLWLAKKYLYGDRKSSVMVTSSQYIAEEGELQDVHEKYVLDSIWARYDAEILNVPMKTADEMAKFTTFSTLGDQVWTWAGINFGCKMTGYVSGTSIVNDDWLISPAMNLSKRLRVTLTFDHVFRYGNNDTIQTTLWVTDNYTTGTQPDTANWKQFNFNFANDNTWTFRTSGEINLNEYAGKANVFIGLRYRSFGTSATTPTWEVKNVLVLEPDAE